MEALPDEMLMEVFSWLSPRSLLGPVPLVCKRWRELARRRELWRHMELSFKAEDFMSFCRIVRLAPALGALKISYLDMTLDDLADNRGLFVGFFDLEDGECPVAEVSRMVYNSLLSGVSDVQVVEMIWVVCMDVQVYLPLLAKFIPYADTLKVSVPPVQWYTAVDGVKKGFFEIIGDMKKLEHLEMQDTVVFQYEGELGRGCSLLKKFVYDPPYLTPFTEEMVLDVLRSHCDRLTYVRLSPVALTPDVTDALKRCPNLVGQDFTLAPNPEKVIEIVVYNPDDDD